MHTKELFMGFLHTNCIGTVLYFLVMVLKWMQSLRVFSVLMVVKIDLSVHTVVDNSIPNRH